MQIAYPLTLIAGMLIAFPASVCGDDSASLPQASLPAPARNVASSGPAPNSGGNPDVLRLKAQAAADKAAILQRRQTGKNLRAAILLLRQSVRLFTAARANSEAADADLQMGEIYVTLSQYDLALKSYREALNLDSKRPEVLCLALSRTARIYATKTGQHSPAGSYSNQALSQCGALPDPKLQAEAWEARGEVLYTAGDSPGAAELLRRARDLFAQAKDNNGRAQALLMLAYARFGSERSEALQLAGEAKQLWESSGNRHGVAQARSALGIFAATGDEFETAQCNYKEALKIFGEVGDKDSEAVVLNGIGYTSRETGDLETSLENYQRAGTIFAGVQDKLGAVETMTEMGKTLTAMRQYQRLLPLYRMKLRLAQETGNAAQAASALVDMAGVYEMQHQYAKAEAFYQRALAAYRSLQHVYGESNILIRLAELQASQGRDSQAIALLESAQILKSKTGQMEDLAKIQYELAHIYRRLNRLEDARAAIGKTIEIIESQRLKIANFDSRASYFASVHKYYSLYIQVLMLLHQQDPERGYLPLAFEASEKSKVRALLDLLNASHSNSSCDELLRRQLAPADATDPGTMSGEQSVSAAPVLTWQQVQTEIADDDTVLLEYALGDEKSYVWVVDSKQILARELPSADQVRKLVIPFREALIARQPLPGENSLDDYNKRVREADLAYQRYARRLSRLLLGPLVLGRAKRVLIVPDGSLQYVPFSALSLPEAGKNNAVLVSHHEVVTLPSVSALSTLRRSAAKRAPATSGAAIVADPVFERDDARVTSVRTSGRKDSPSRPFALMIARSDIPGLQHIVRLPGSREEANAIRRALKQRNVVVVQDFDATREYVVQGALNRYRIIHFATHGIINARHPEMSGLVLSLVNRKGQLEDGYLRLGDIYKLKLSADLVVLSACNSALGKDLESEGIIGLPRGFLYAGAKTVIASFWKVDDEATAELMEGFYGRIQRGESPSSALRGAQLQMSRGPRWPEPFYWAAFVLQGDYK